MNFVCLKCTFKHSTNKGKSRKVTQSQVRLKIIMSWGIRKGITKKLETTNL